MDPVLLSELTSAVRGQASSLDGDGRFVRVCTDTRELRRGDLFWALPGRTFDGHQFVSQAFQKGAVAAVVEHARSAGWSGPLIRVESTLAALGDFARWYRQQRESLVIGVTGSVGKTTTKEMIFAALSDVHPGHRSQKSYNNEVGLPLSLLELNGDHEFGVFEMGATRLGDIRALCEIACPEVGVIPKVGISHLASFGSHANIVRAKGELLEALPPHGFAVLGGDDDALRGMASRALCSTIFVGEKAGNQVRATDVAVTPERLRFQVDRRKYEVPGASRQHLTSALCAIAVAREIGMQPADIAAGLAKYTPPPGRGKAEPCGPWIVIDDTYNANPTSLQAAFLSLGDWPSEGLKLFVAGDMLELGPAADDLHREAGAVAGAAGIDQLLAIGQHAEALVAGAMAAGLPPHAAAVCRDDDILWMLLDCWLSPGAVVQVKGSRAARMERVVEWIKTKATQEHRNHQARPRRAVA